MPTARRSPPPQLSASPVSPPVGSGCCTHCHDALVCCRINDSLTGREGGEGEEGVREGSSEWQHVGRQMGLQEPRRRSLWRRRWPSSARSHPGRHQHFDREKVLSRQRRGAVRASSIFPILSVILLFMGGLCIAASEFYKSRHNIILSAGIFFVSAGLSNIIGIIVYISANAGDPSKSDSKKNSYSYGWSFYFGALSFIMAEMVGVLAVHMFIDRHRQLRIGARAADYLQGSAITRIPSYRYRYRRRSRSSSRSTDPSHSRDASPVGLKGFSALPSTEISMYTLPRDTLKSSGTPTATYNSERDHNFLQVHNCIQKDLKDSSHTNTANRRTTPV
ncbi:hypothetical protein INR49_030422 [Caranx melampygus]|nr:hypothetical protein INR49_030422 [Caranx melampygus]